LAGEEDIEGAGAEEHEEEFGKAAGTAFGDEGDFFVFGGGEGEGFLFPGVVDKEGMRAGGNFARDGLAEHEFGDGLAVEGDDDLALLGVVRCIASDGEGGGHGISLGEVVRKGKAAEA